MNKSTYTILSFLKNVATESAELATIFFEIGYYAHKNTIRRACGDTRTYSSKKLEKHDEQRRLLKNYQQRLYILEKNGLILRQRKNKKTIFSLTKEGKKQLQEVNLNKMIISDHRYEKKKSDYPTIVTFDIPEIKKKKRDWLRTVLRELEFTMIQKSVWIGTNYIPEDFIKDLHTSGILSYIDFFEVKKSGTLAASLHKK